MLVLSIIIDSTYEDEFLHKCCFFEGGKLLKDIKTKGRYTGAKLPKTVFHASKELVRKSLLAAKEKRNAGGAEWNGWHRAGCPTRKRWKSEELKSLSRSTSTR